MQEQHLFHDRYRLTRLLGRGNFSEVWLADDVKTDTSIALKVYAPGTGLDDDGLKLFAREFAIVLNANHRNLLKPMHYDVCDRKPYLVLPYCSEGSTQRRVGMFKEEDIWRLLHDVAGGLAFLHGMKPPVIHQDIKPDNIMVSDGGDYMLTDFGVSSHCKSVLRRSVSEAFASAGTMAYMAPERFGKDAGTPIMASDIYSLGATAYELLMGTPPFGNDGGLIQKKGADIPELKDSFSEDLRKVVRLCLCSEPWKRPTAATLERYASAGMQKKHVLLDGEKPFFKKYLLVFVLAAVLAVAGIVMGVNGYRSHAERAEAERLALVEQQRTDSVVTLAGRHVASGEKLYKKASLKDENYDNTYLLARKEYAEAVALMKTVKARQADIAAAEKCIAEIDTALSAARKLFMQKAQIFSDDPSVKAEFENRARKIEETINNK